MNNFGTHETRTNNSNLSDSALNVADRFTQLDGRKLEEIQTLSMQEYQNCSQEFLGKKEIITEKDIQNEISFFKQINKIHKYFPPNMVCTVSIIPFSINGQPLEPMEITNRDFLVRFLINQNSQNEDLNAARVIRFLPHDIQQQCSFSTDNYQLNEANPVVKVSPEVREKIILQYETALRNLQKLLQPSQSPKP